MSIRLSASLEDGRIVRLVSKDGELAHDFMVPSAGTYYRTLHDFEAKHWDYKPRSITLNYKSDPPSNALPETVPLEWNKSWGTRTDFFPLNEAWQNWLCFDLMGHAHPSYSRDELKALWKAVTGPSVAFTDRHSIKDGFCDYVNGINIGGKPIAWKNITTGGNLLLMRQKVSGAVVFEALDIAKPPPPIESVWGKPWLVHWATEETTLALENNRWRVSPFPQAPGVPIPLLARGGLGSISDFRVVLMKNGTQFSPYVP